MTKKQRHGKKPPPPPTQAVPPTQVLGAPFVIDPDVVDMQRELDRKAGAEKHHLDAQLTEKDLAAIDEHRRQRPNAKSSKAVAEWIHGDPDKTDKTIAKWMRRDPETRIIRRKKGKPVLKDGKPQLLSVRALRRKIPPPQK
jgi:hypothetical protein